MSDPLEKYQGSFLLEQGKIINPIPPNYQDVEAVKTCCQLFSRSKKTKLTFSILKDQFQSKLAGTLSFEASINLEINGFNMRPEFDVDGLIRIEKFELSYSANMNSGTLEFYLHILPPDDVSIFEDYSVYFGTFKRIRHTQEQLKPDSNKPKYPIDPKMIGHWRYGDHYFSGNFSSYSETNLYLGPDGRFIRSNRNFTTSNFTDSAGNWTGMGHTDSGLKANEKGHWAVKDGKFFLIFDDATYIEAPFEFNSNSLLLFLKSKNQLWKKVG